MGSRTESFTAGLGRTRTGQAQVPVWGGGSLVRTRHRYPPRVLSISSLHPIADGSAQLNICSTAAQVAIDEGCCRTDWTWMLWRMSWRVTTSDSAGRLY